MNAQLPRRSTKKFIATCECGASFLAGGYGRSKTTRCRPCQKKSNAAGVEARRLAATAAARAGRSCCDCGGSMADDKTGQPRCAGCREQRRARKAAGLETVWQAPMPGGERVAVEPEAGPSPGEPDAPRPLRRSDCEAVARPCPWSACRYHLPGAGASCVLDVADKAAVSEVPPTLHEVGVMLGVSHERARQIEAEAMAKLRKLGIHQLLPGRQVHRLPVLDDDADE